MREPVLAPHLLHAFRSVIRSRGDAYAHAGAVTVTSTSADSATADVVGAVGSTYRVEVAVRRTTRSSKIAASCSCAHFERGEACKHLWATIRVLDAQGWTPSLPGESERSPIALVAVEPNVQSAPPKRRSAERAWRARVRALASPHPRVQPARSAHALATPSEQALVLYLIDPDAVPRDDGVRVDFAHRPLRRDGSAGALRAVSITSGALSPARTAEEAALLAQLRTLAEARRAIERPYYDESAYGGRGRLSIESVVIPPALLDPLLPRIAATGRLGIASRDTQEPSWLRLDPGAPWQLRLELAPAPRGYELRGRYVRGAEVLALDATELVLSAGWLIHGTTLARADTGGDAGVVTDLQRAPIAIPARELDAALAELTALPGLPPLDLADGVPWSERRETPRLRLRVGGLDVERTREVEARLDFGYGKVWLSSDAPAERVADPASRALLSRDADAETRALDTLAALGFRASPLRDGVGAALALPIERFETAASELLAKGWTVEAEGLTLRRAGRSSARVSSGIDFFDLAGGIEFDDAVASFPALLAAARDGARFVRLGGGAGGLLPNAWIERCARLAGVAEVDGDRLRFRRAQASFLDALLTVQDDTQVDQRFRTLRRELARFEGIAPASEPPHFAGTLRVYQREGLGWLGFLERFGLGGCLADDMGLGKTVQVLALLAARASQPGRSGAHSPSLVVAPRSVMHGWVDEAARFAPRLRVLRYDGPGRASLRARFGEVDLVVTTYGTLRRDAAALGLVRFDYAILDEAQAIKNGRSKTARAACALRAEHRLVLTGTPIENHLADLASLLEFSNPGLLGRSGGLAPLVGAGGDLALLARALRPLILRRTKEQVLPELPPKTEQTIFCDLAPAERRQYDELRRHFQMSLAQQIEQHGLARSKIHVLEALLRLRQAACHPALLDPERTGESSTKLEVLFASLEEVMAEGHKALVFSQFTRFLAQVRAGLDERGISYAYLDGKTRDRPERIARFEQDPACRVFLISLKAGGTGLNLTAADYVYLLDPWWNPAVEAQAVDRTHRIGQTRPVFAYRLVARDTVEEKILALQERKRGLADAILTSDASLLQSLTADDLRLLLG